MHVTHSKSKVARVGIAVLLFPVLTAHLQVLVYVFVCVCVCIPELETEANYSLCRIYNPLGLPLQCSMLCIRMIITNPYTFLRMICLCLFTTGKYHRYTL